MTKHTTYAKMIDSGFPWIGKIPFHWETLRFKHLLKERNDRSPSGSEQLLRVSQYTGVTERRADTESGEPDTRAKSLVGYKLASSSDLVVNIMLAWNGSLGVSPFNGIVSPAYCVFKILENLNPKYLHYLLRTPQYKGLFKTVSTGIVESRLRLYPEQFFQLYGLVPPLPEQAAIVRYLDHMDKRIRKAILAKQKLIKLLDEQKQAIIHQAVTRGLDPQVQLKPSGVEWLGEVPEGWEVLQLRRLVSFVTSGSRSWGDFFSDTGDLFLQSGNLGRNMAVDLSKVQYVLPPIGAEGLRTKVSPEDILICITGALTGNVVHVDKDFTVPAYINQHVALVRPISRLVNSRYLAYVIYSAVGKGHFKRGEYGGTKQGLGLMDVKTALVPTPRIEVQEEITSFLDQVLEKHSGATSIIKHQIAYLQEYRTRLIADVVTGKVDVREAAASLPEEVADTTPEETELLDESDEPEDEEITEDEA